MLDEIALGGVERLERGLGKGAALRALLTVHDSMSPGAARARVCLRAMVLAGELGERELLDDLCDAWASATGALHADARAAVAQLLGEGRADAARRVAGAELRRAYGGFDEAGAHYLVGRSLERAGDHEAAVEAYSHVVTTAEGQPRLVLGARVRMVRSLSLAGEPAEAARVASDLLPLEEAPEVDRLQVALAALASPGRYRRAAALDVLERLAAEAAPELRALAVARVAAHVERAAGALSAIELDRAGAVIGHHPDEEPRRRALERLRAIAELAAGEPSGVASAIAADPASERSARRAAPVLDGLAPGPRPVGEGRALSGWLALEVVHSTRGGYRREALHALRELTRRVEDGERVEAPMWTAAVHGLRVHPGPARRLLRALLEAGGEPPPRGFAWVADALEAAGRVDDAIAMLRRAAMRREPSARGRLADHLRAAGWAAADDGRREEAKRLLREAKALYEG